MKDYIRDGGKVRRCPANILKMNIFEYMYFDVFHWGCFNSLIRYLTDSFKQFIEGIFYFIINVIMLMIFPIMLIIRAIVGIKENKIKLKWLF